MYFGECWSELFSLKIVDGAMILKPLSESDQQSDEDNGRCNNSLFDPPLYIVSSKSPPPYTVSSISIL